MAGSSCGGRFLAAPVITTCCTGSMCVDMGTASASWRCGQRFRGHPQRPCMRAPAERSAVLISLVVRIHAPTAYHAYGATDAKEIGKHRWSKSSPDPHPTP